MVLDAFHTEVEVEIIQQMADLVPTIFFISFFPLGGVIPLSKCSWQQMYLPS